MDRVVLSMSSISLAVELSEVIGHGAEALGQGTHALRHGTLALRRGTLALRRGVFACPSDNSKFNPSLNICAYFAHSSSWAARTWRWSPMFSDVERQSLDVER